MAFFDPLILSVPEFGLYGNSGIAKVAFPRLIHSNLDDGRAVLIEPMIAIVDQVKFDFLKRLDFHCDTEFDGEKGERNNYQPIHSVHKGVQKGE